MAFGVTRRLRPVRHPDTGPADKASRAGRPRHADGRADRDAAPGQDARDHRSDRRRAAGKGQTNLRIINVLQRHYRQAARPPPSKSARSPGTASTCSPPGRPPCGVLGWIWCRTGLRRREARDRPGTISPRWSKWPRDRRFAVNVARVKTASGCVSRPRQARLRAILAGLCGSDLGNPDPPAAELDRDRVPRPDRQAHDTHILTLSVLQGFNFGRPAASRCHA